MGFSTNTYLLGELGWYLSRAKRYSEAIDIYRKLVQLEPSIAKWPYMLGYQYYSQQGYESALPHFDHALNLSPEYIKVLYRKGYALSQMEGRNGDALTSYEQCRTAYRNLQDPDTRDREEKYYVDACYQQGKLLLALGKRWQAQARLVEAADLRPDDPDILYSLGKCYLEDGQFHKAIDTLDKARSLSARPQHYVLDKLAQAYSKAEQPEKALRIYREMPSSLRKPYILRNMGEICIKLNLDDEAERILEEATKREHRNHNGHFLLGLAYQKNGKYRKAAKAFQTAMDLRMRHYNKPFPEAESALTNLLREHPEQDEEDLVVSQPNSSSRQTGIITKYFDDRGFGFVSREGSPKDLFFHITRSHLINRYEAG